MVCNVGELWNEHNGKIMSKISALKQAMDQLEIDLSELASAQAQLSSWQEYDLRRTDGSGRQDALHEQRGQNLEDCVSHAKQKVEAQKGQISVLLSTV
jgi:hypothetical protein